MRAILGKDYQGRGAVLPFAVCLSGLKGAASFPGYRRNSKIMKLKNVLKAIAVLGCAGALAVSFAACGGGEEEKPAGKTHDPVTLEVTGKTGTYEPHNFVDGKCTMCDETTIFTQDTIAKDAIVSTACDQQGTITKITYETDAYGEDVITKTAYVYTPYGYNAEDTTTKYDVLYLVHGKGLNEGYWFAQGSYKKDDSIYQSGGNGTTNVLDTMMKDGDAKKAIIVTPTFYLPGEDGTTDSSDDSMNKGVAGFGDELVNDLMPYIAKNYNTYATVTADMTAEQVDAALKANRAHQGYAGLSLGSMISFSIVWTDCLDYFAYIGSYSGAVSLEQAQAIVTAANTTYKEDKIGYWYVGLGTSENNTVYPGDPFGCYRTMMNGIDGLQSGSDLAAGDNCEFVQCNKTGHNYQSWITALYNSLQVFFKADLA